MEEEKKMMVTISLSDLLGLKTDADFAKYVKRENHELRDKISALETELKKYKTGVK